MLTLAQLIEIVPTAGKRAAIFINPLNLAMERFQINTPKRVAAFIAQVAHESGSFYYTKEIASGKAYEGRTDLGNTQPGDGVKYKGHGLIQITGRANHLACGRALGLDLIEHPEMLEQPEPAALSAGWFWHDFKNLNPLADAGEFLKITKRINGGTNGLADREQFYNQAKRVLCV